MYGLLEKPSLFWLDIDSSMQTSSSSQTGILELQECKRFGYGSLGQ